MYTAASMPAETGPVASASLGSAIENGGRERLGQLWHPASKCRTATERLGVCGTGRHQSRDGLASIRNCDFVPLSNLSNQCRQVLPGFTYSCFFHPAIVLHVDRKSTRLNSSHSQISYAVFCLKKKKSVELRRVHANPRHSAHPLFRPPSLVVSPGLEDAQPSPLPVRFIACRSTSESVSLRRQ